MNGLRYRFAQWVLEHRLPAYSVFALLTLFFVAGLPRVSIETVFSDLLPRDDPYVQVFRDHPYFGNPLTMTVMVESRTGSIYNPATLQKIYDLTWQLDLAPAVDHDMIVSIASDKARYAKSTPDGLFMRPVMDAEPAATPEAVKAFRQRVQHSPKVQGFLISADESATLLQATFIERSLDYGESFEYVQGLVEQARDDQHRIHLAGQPALIGWVYRHEWAMVGIFLLTIAALVLALVIYMRSLVGVLTPIITSSVAAIWAFGFVGWLDIPIEPLLMVVPLLLIARSFSHSVQFTERFQEIHAECRDRQEAARRTMLVMMTPSVLSILTDVMGIAVIVAAPIPAMVRHAVFCGMWAVWLIPTGVVLISLLLSSLPAPPQAGQGRRIPAEKRLKALFQAGMGGIAALSSGRRAGYTAFVVAIVTMAAIITASQLRIGNPVQGTALLRADSEFNTAVRQINRHFPGTNTVEIVLEATNPHDPRWTAQHLDTVQTLIKLQHELENSDFPPTATLSFADYLMDYHRMFNGGNPKWLFIPPTQRAASGAAFATILTINPKNLSHVMTYDGRHLAVSLWYPDNRQETVDRALAAAQDAVDAVGREHDAFRVRLGTGVIPLQNAVNDVVERYHVIIVLLLDAFIFLMFSLAYRSILAGLILLVPVNISHFAMMASMHMLGVGLDVNSLIVAAIGLGVGIDYGIYLLSRIREEYSLVSRDWEAATRAALLTTGKAILFTASIMAIGIMPLCLLSDLKFVADMGLLIMAIMAINMVAALIVLPLLVNLIRPKFIGEKSGGVASLTGP